VTDASLMLSISIGVAMHKDGDNVESLVERADQAMYSAKLNGRNQVVLYEAATAPTMPNPPRMHVVEKRRKDS
jgi:predicted signal transduction protein with EAL and GGDEF domain